MPFWKFQYFPASEKHIIHSAVPFSKTVDSIMTLSNNAGLEVVPDQDILFGFLVFKAENECNK